jgi:hypothetical protein
MGKRFYDKYSLLHFAVGICSYYFSIPVSYWLIFHVLFEIIENSKYGMHVINKYLTMWPGGKPESDSLINSISDILFGILGWLVAYCVNKY